MEELKYKKCSHCVFDEHNTFSCCVSRLDLAFYYLCKEIPIINRIKKEPECLWFADKEDSK